MATMRAKMQPLGSQADSKRRDPPRNGGGMIKNRCNERKRRSIESRRVKQEIGRKSKKIADVAAPQICTPQKKWPDASTAMLSLGGSRVSQFVDNSVVVEEPSHALSSLEQSLNVAANEKSTDESSPDSHDCTPTDPKAHCTVVWSNAAYRSELNSDGGSSSSERCFSDCLAEALINDQRGDSDISGGDRNCRNATSNGNADSSDFRSPEPGYGWLDNGCTGESVGSAAVVDLGSLSLTKKALIEYPEFRDAKLEDRREDLSPTVRCDKSSSAYSGATDIENSLGEGWVHGPECDIENDLTLAKLEAELEDEIERKLEEELETDIAALSQKLAHLHARQEAKQINQGNPVLKSTSLAAQSKSYTGKASINISSGKPVSGKFVRPSHKPGAGNKCIVQEAKVKRPGKAADSKKRHAEAKANQEMQVVSKGDKADLSKSGQDTVCGNTGESLGTHGDVSRCIEEQLQSLKLSPSLWRKKFDWVKSLRSGGLANPPLLKKASEVGSRKEGITRTVFAEKNCESSSRFRNVDSKHESLGRGTKNLLQENRILQGPSGAPHLLNKLPKQPTPVAKRDAIKTPTKSKQPSTAPGKTFAEDPVFRTETGSIF